MKMSETPLRIPPPIKKISAFEPDPSQPPNPDVDSPTHLEVALNVPDGSANRLFIYTGVAKIDVRPTQDDNLRTGFVQIVLPLVLSDWVQVINAACYAGLAGFQNIDRDTATTFDVEAATLLQVPDPVRGDGFSLPVLQASVSVLGDQGNTSIVSISYQANLQVLVGFDFQVGFGGAASVFGNVVTVKAGQPWLGLIRLANPAPTDLHVSFTSLQPQFAPAPSGITILAGQTSSGILTAPNTNPLGSLAEVDAPMQATLVEAGLTEMAMVRVTAV
jgi:hypothetical protein